LHVLVGVKHVVKGGFILREGERRREKKLLAFLSWTVELC